MKRDDSFYVDGKCSFSGSSLSKTHDVQNGNRVTVNRRRIPLDKEDDPSRADYVATVWRRLTGADQSERSKRGRKRPLPIKNSPVHLAGARPGEQASGGDDSPCVTALANREGQ
jgi:hypothetical protein